MLHKSNKVMDRRFAISVPPNSVTDKPPTTNVPIQQSSSPRDRMDIVLHMIGTRTIGGGTRLLR